MQVARSWVSYIIALCLTANVAARAWRPRLEVDKCREICKPECANVTVSEVSEWCAVIESSLMTRTFAMKHCYFVFVDSFNRPYQMEQGPIDTDRDWPSGYAEVVCSPFTIEHIPRGEPWEANQPAGKKKKEKSVQYKEKKLSVAPTKARKGLSVEGVFKSAQKFLDDNPKYALAFGPDIQGGGRDCQDFSAYAFNANKNLEAKEVNRFQTMNMDFLTRYARTRDWTKSVVQEGREFLKDLEFVEKMREMASKIAAMARKKGKSKEEAEIAVETGMAQVALMSSIRQRGADVKDDHVQSLEEDLPRKGWRLPHHTAEALSMELSRYIAGENETG